ncbi:MFS transporter [Pseudooceanicola sediminis]|uniref:MFS transporter n=1 Tax=Pseudooceanicola sediminis TaxID=2211117 RepID=A0A399J7P7_9RHOB|nr:MDR family MFS transporter [Pseudooceanicola sediminis]KAA2314116.1 MFS transporter [Puniceibacterium sp. HSS470]RII40022.1 MFS transporter [Pseudooceanicola sediminis]|tara:strand:+ start:88561 stop:90111 length:1551 start_codon:yes stop_codon:yes gene_type:complete
MISPKDRAETTTAAQDIPSPDSRRLRVVLLTVALTLFLASTGQSIVSTALPEIVSDLGGLSYITWVVTAYLLSSTIGAPIAGKLGDMYGRKIVLQCAIVIFLLGGAIAGMAWNMPVLILGRIIQGLGGGSLIVVSMAVVADVLPPRERARAQGTLSAVFGVSTVLGPLVGGFLVQSVGWHWIFFVNLPFGVAAFVVLTRTLAAQAQTVRHKMDYLGAVLLMCFLSALVLLANLAGTILPWGSVATLALMGLTVLSLAAFLLNEARASEPVMPLLLFRVRNYQVANSVNFLVGMAMFGTISFVPMFLQVVKGVEPARSGLYLIAMMAGLIGGSFSAGRFMTRTGRYKFLPPLATGLLCIALIALSRIGPETPLWQIAANLAFVGMGIGPNLSVGVVSIQTAIPREHLGVGTASANMFRLTGGAVGTSIFGAVFNHGMALHVQPLMPQLERIQDLTTSIIAQLEPIARAEVVQGFSNAISPMFLIGAVVAALACLISLRLVELPLGAGSSQRGSAPAE